MEMGWRLDMTAIDGMVAGDGLRRQDAGANSEAGPEHREG